VPGRHDETRRLVHAVPETQPPFPNQSAVNQDTAGPKEVRISAMRVLGIKLPHVRSTLSSNQLSLRQSRFIGFGRPPNADLFASAQDAYAIGQT
jgi:hypothetical protein